MYGNMFSTVALGRKFCLSPPSPALLQAGLSLPQPSPHRVPFRGIGDRGSFVGCFLCQAFALVLLEPQEKPHHVPSQFCFLVSCHVDSS